MTLKIVVASGKGGTGKTLIATNLAKVLETRGRGVTYLDCDVEEPNGHLFLKPEITHTDTVKILSPMRIDPDRCTGCGKCSGVCNYNAIAVLRGRAMLFTELCHVCGACLLVCPETAIIEEQRHIGDLKHGRSGRIAVHYGLLKTAEGGMSARLIAEVKQCAGDDVTILDSPPGTACPSVEAVRDCDLCLLVADPTPFAINDLKISVNMCRRLGLEPVVILNRAGLDPASLVDYCEQAELEIVGEIPDSRRIAETYSVGDLIVENLPEFRKYFEQILDRALELAAEKRAVKKPSPDEDIPADARLRKASPATGESEGRLEELVVISGKGGTGKTSLVACFAALAKDKVIADCDVDAADLHLVLKPDRLEEGTFSGGYAARIVPERCNACGRCYDICRFNAVREEDGAYRLDDLACEGCGACALVCPADAIELEKAVNGRWFISQTRHGKMAHAALGIAEENSGRLVTLVRELAAEVAGEEGNTRALMDGSPGTGCPVIASLTGVRYAVVVTEPTVSGLHDMGRILDLVNHFRVRTGVIVNKWDLNQDMAERIEAAAREAGAKILGRIPYDDAFVHSQIEGLSLVEYGAGQARQSVREIWEKVAETAFGRVLTATGEKDE